jgi:hypothetical protein
MFTALGSNYPAAFHAANTEVRVDRLDLVSDNAKGSKVHSRNGCAGPEFLPFILRQTSNNALERKLRPEIDREIGFSGIFACRKTGFSLAITYACK